MLWSKVETFTNNAKKLWLMNYCLFALQKKAKNNADK